MHQMHASLFALIGAVASGRGISSRRLEGLGKWKDGEPTGIDCSASSHDYEYYIERCLDGTTQWWINGHCVGGVKEEVSELHRCMKPDGSRSYCHDCNDGLGNIKNVCGSDNPEKDEVCDIAWASTPEGCGDQGLTVYSHQCIDPPGSGGTDHWYLRESMYCDTEENWRSGPYNEDVPPLPQFSCGRGWYYEYEEEDGNLLKIDRSWTNIKHPFSTASNEYCLDCGLAIQVCHGGEASSTCGDLGLPEKGGEFGWWAEASGAAPATVVDAAAETTPAASGNSSPDETSQEAAKEPVTTKLSPDESPASADEPSDPVPNEVDPVQVASSAFSFHSWNSLVLCVVAVVGVASTVFM